jgi:heat shock protein HslJ
MNTSNLPNSTPYTDREESPMTRTHLTPPPHGTLRLWLCAAAGGLVLAGCSPDAASTADPSVPSTTAPSADDDTAATTFDVFETADITGYDLMPGTTVSISISPDTDAVALNAGCNTLVGSLDRTAGTLSTTDDGSVASTMMACDQGLGMQDEWLRGFVASNPTWALDGDTVTLTSPTATIAARRVSG